MVSDLTVVSNQVIYSDAESGRLVRSSARRSLNRDHTRVLVALCVALVLLVVDLLIGVLVDVSLLLLRLGFGLLGL